MRRIIAPLLVILIILIGTFMGALWWKSNSAAVSQDPTLNDFLITKGLSASQIGNKLRNEGLIRSPLAFRLYVQLTSKAKKIQAGEYRLSASDPLTKIVGLLTKGPVEVWVTIPEGTRREEIAERFAASFGLADKEGFVREFLQSSTAMEGFLFPDTYLFPKTASASAVVKKLRETFDLRIDSEITKQIVSSGYSLEQILTMASIIERETLTDEERPIVAGILFKRLEAGWPLQADASLQYAIATERCQGVLVGCRWWEPPNKQDLEVTSVFNTYKYPGLPPRPIANPGINSIKAAASYEESDYWFYLHDASGEIHYARTLEEHNENVRKYLNK